MGQQQRYMFCLIFLVHYAAVNRYVSALSVGNLLWHAMYYNLKGDCTGIFYIHGGVYITVQLLYTRCPKPILCPVVPEDTALYGLGKQGVSERVLANMFSNRI